ncbi:MAG: hypothetical protein NTX44_05370 [Ignavibacteriales bacterium]|nr:hypothetical protein [Ignavibacteriales bacterium]
MTNLNSFLSLSFIFVMKHIVILIIFLGLLCGSCSTSQSSLPTEGVLEGTIFAIGNDPFTKLGLQTTQNQMYVLRCSKEIEKELNTKQGQKMRIQYDTLENTPEGITVRVISYERQ